MSDYAPMPPKQWVREEPTNQLRWKRGYVKAENRLQQAWKVENWVGDYIDTVEIDWRDVPTEG
jgi:hypothetical protein